VDIKYPPSGQGYQAEKEGLDLIIFIIGNMNIIISMLNNLIL
jgi:hypothetical protein